MVRERIFQSTGTKMRKVLAGIITDPVVCSRVSAKWGDNGGLFDNAHANLVAKWCFDHQAKFGSPPNGQLPTIFHNWATTTKAGEATVSGVEQLLINCSEEYKQGRDKPTTDFLLDQADAYFNDLAVRRKIEEAQEELDRGNTETARTILNGCNRIQLGTESTIDLSEDYAAWVDAFDESRQRQLIRYPGKLDAFLGSAMARDSLVAFVAPDKAGKCIAGDMEVLVADGRLCRIEDIVRSGKPVELMSFDVAANRFVPIMVSDFWSNGEKPCVEVTTKSGRKCITTLNHKYLTPDGWKELGQIECGEFVAVPRRLDVFGDVDMKPELVRFLAYMMAEGCCVQTRQKGKHGWKKGSFACSFSNSCSVIGEDFERCCRELGVTFRRRGLNWCLSGNARPILREYGVLGCDSRTKEIPSDIFRTTKENVALFLKVFFSCDGHISRAEDSVEITLVSEKLIKQISQLLVRFGIVHKVDYKPTSYKGRYVDSWRICIDGVEYVSRFLNEINFLSARVYGKPPQGRSYLDRIPYQVADEIYKGLAEEYSDDSVYSSRGGIGGYIRKGHSFREFFGKSKAGYVRERIAKKKPLCRKSFSHVWDHPLVQSLLGGDSYWDEVVSIVRVGNRKTYDLAVPEHHNFVANNCIVHNSFLLLDAAYRAAMGRCRVAYFDTGDNSRDQVIRRFAIRATRRPIRAGSLKVPKTVNKGEDGEYQVTFSVRDYLDNLGPEESFREYNRIFRRKNQLKLECHPNSSITVDDIAARLREWAREGWVADVVIIDYADILAEPRGVKDELKQIDETWKRLRRLSQELHCLVLTATQAKSTAYNKKTSVLRKEHFSGRKTKNAHVNGMIGINVSDKDKEQNIMRFNWVVRREGQYTENQTVVVAGCLAIGNPIVKVED